MEMKLTDMLSKAVLLEQCAEECSELGQACLKLARKYRNENPTPKDEDELLENLTEEVADVTLCAGILADRGLVSNDELKEIMYSKMKRWKGRLKEHNNTRSNNYKPESCEECFFKNIKNETCDITGIDVKDLFLVIHDRCPLQRIYDTIKIIQ